MDLRALWRCCVPITGPPTSAPPALIVLFSPFCGTALLPLCAHLFHWAYKCGQVPGEHTPGPLTCSPVRSKGTFHDPGSEMPPSAERQGGRGGGIEQRRTFFRRIILKVPC